MIHYSGQERCVPFSKHLKCILEIKWIDSHQQQSCSPCPGVQSLHSTLTTFSVSWATCTVLVRRILKDLLYRKLPSGKKINGGFVFISIMSPKRHELTEHEYWKVVGYCKLPPMLGFWSAQRSKNSKRLMHAAGEMYICWKNTLLKQHPMTLSLSVVTATRTFLCEPPQLH